MKKKLKRQAEEEEDYEGMDGEELEEGEAIEKKPKKKVKRRYDLFAVQARMGIIDTETKEILCEGEYAVLEILANILERLERMETTIGSLVE